MHFKTIDSLSCIPGGGGTHQGQIQHGCLLKEWLRFTHLVPFVSFNVFYCVLFFLLSQYQHLSLKSKIPQEQSPPASFPLVSTWTSVHLLCRPQTWNLGRSLGEINLPDLYRWNKTRRSRSGQSVACLDVGIFSVWGTSDFFCTHSIKRFVVSYLKETPTDGLVKHFVNPV